MDNNKKILYIGPYNERSNVGLISLNNIKALQKAGHNIKIIPIYAYIENDYNTTPEEILPLENNNIDEYDICIQHCDPSQYSFNGCFKKNIGIYTCKNIVSEPIINTRLSLLDKIIVNSNDIYKGLSRIISRDIYKNISYCPPLVDINHIKSYNKEKLDWIDNKKYYFYTELEFTEEYDWEKLIYVYMTSFKHKNCGLIIKTSNISEDEDVSDITYKINKIAISANINPETDNKPQILNGLFDEKTIMQIYNSIHCFIDCGRSHEYNMNIFLAAALNKDLICNSELSSAKLFSTTYQVDAHQCNINYHNLNQNLFTSMYDTSYTMEINSLKNNMLASYHNKDMRNNIDEQELCLYDTSNINNLLC